MSTTTLRCILKYKSITSRLNVGSLSNKCIFRKYSNIVNSEFADIEIPNITMPEFVFEHFDKFPHKIAVECAVTGKNYTFEEIRTKSRNLSRALRKKLKLSKGDVVAVLLPNIPEFPICILGALQAGLRVMTINPAYTGAEIKRQLQDSEAKAVITLGYLYSTVQAALKLIPAVHIPILTIKFQISDTTPQDSINFAEFTDTKFDIDDLPPGDPNDIFLMVYSSGTTGLPKGVQHSHHSMVANIHQINHSYLKLAEDTTASHQDVVPAVLPYFHLYGLIVVLLNHLHNMSKLVSLPQFTQDVYVNTLAKHKPHILYVVPPIVILMSNNPIFKKEHLQSVRAICSAAAPLGALDEEKLVQKAEKSLNIVQGYGLTESCIAILGSGQKTSKLDLSGSVGEVVPNTLAKVVPADNVYGKELGPNESGELLIKGPQIMKGYYNKPKETQETFVDGWLRTGDMAYYDNNKMFYITDRLKELIKVNAFQVAPAELEEIIRSHPEVSDAAVIGVSNSTYGEVPRAYVVAKPNVKLDTIKLKQYVANKVANYKQLRGGIVVVDGIPKSASGKILRKDLKLHYEKEGTL